VLRACAAANAPARVSQVWAHGGAGGVEVAEATLEAMRDQTSAAFEHLYPDDMPLARKLELIAKAVYGADGINLLPAVADKLARFERCGFRDLPVCVAKTQNSLSDDPKKLGRPRGFEVLIRDAKLSAGAGFVVAYAGDVMTMPGLPKEPSAEIIDIDGAGNTVGLF
jgi:formate--tetrahydrofolate ligase